jgi:hypothetical protein
MGSELTVNKDYRAWLAEIKLKIRSVQIKAALKVNTELLVFYWELGEDIVAKQLTAHASVLQNIRPACSNCETTCFAIATKG